MCNGQGQQGAQRPGMKTVQGGYMGAPRPTYPGMQSATGPYMDDSSNPAGGGYSGSAVAPTGDAAGGGYYQPPRLPPIVPGIQGNEGGYTGAPGYATTPQTQAPSLSAPYSPGTATGEQRPPYSADPPPMGEPGGTRMPPIQPPPGGWPMAPGYTPPAYDPSTDPLAQGGATGGGNGGLFGGLNGGTATPYTQAMTPTGPGRSGGAGMHLGAQLKRGISNIAREYNQQPAIKAARQAQALAAIQANPSLAHNVNTPWQDGYGVGPNQYVDKNGQLQYGYGEGDPRNGGAPLYDDPVSGLKGTLGPKPGFNYNDPKYYGAGNAPSAPSMFAKGVSTLSPAEQTKYMNPWITGVK